MMLKTYTMLSVASMLLCCLLKAADDTAINQLQSLYHSLQQGSLAEQAAFAELYPDTAEGAQASQTVWQLLTGTQNREPPPQWPVGIVQKVVNRFVNPSADSPEIPTELLNDLLIQHARELPHRKLRGHQIWSEAELIALPSEEIDLARGLLISQRLTESQILSYESCLDLMALQVLASVPVEHNALDLVRALSNFIFVKQRFRFPPKHRMNVEIDQWTILSQVLDSRRGVCLGVSQLYLCLAQRLGINLEILTPPGHIFVRWAEDGRDWNIETTAHGMPLPTATYLGLTCRSLTPRSLREVLGMNLYNAASRPLSDGRSEEALQLYERAEQYMPDDPNLLKAKGMALVGCGRTVEAKQVLEQVKDLVTEEQVVPDDLVREVLQGDADAELLRLILREMPTERKALYALLDDITAAIERKPNCFSAYHHLAVVYLNLGRTAEAFEVVQRAYQRGCRNPFLVYLACELSLHRFDLIRAAEYFTTLKDALQQANHYPQIVEDIEQRLTYMGALDYIREG